MTTAAEALERALRVLDRPAARRRRKPSAPPTPPFDPSRPPRWPRSEARCGDAARTAAKRPARRPLARGAWRRRAGRPAPRRDRCLLPGARHRARPMPTCTSPSPSCTSIAAGGRRPPTSSLLLGRLAELTGDTATRERLCGRRGATAGRAAPGAICA